MKIYKKYSTLCLLTCLFITYVLNAEAEKSDAKMALREIVSNHNLAFGKDNLQKSYDDRPEKYTEWIGDYGKWRNALEKYLAFEDKNAANKLVAYSDILKDCIEEATNSYNTLYKNNVMTDNSDVMLIAFNKNIGLLNTLNGSLSNLEKIQSFESSERIKTATLYLLTTFEKLKKDINKCILELKNKIYPTYDSENIFLKTPSDKDFEHRNKIFENSVTFFKNGNDGNLVEAFLRENNYRLQEILKTLSGRFSRYFQDGFIIYTGNNQTPDSLLLQNKREEVRAALKKLENDELNSIFINNKKKALKELEAIRSYLYNKLMKIEKDIDQLLIIIRNR